MPKCTKIRVKKRSVCLGDLRHEIKILERAQASPGIGSVDYSEPSKVKLLTFAGIETAKGSDSFDGVGADRTQRKDRFTHIFYIRYVPECEITSQNWIEFGCDYYRIVNEVENLDVGNEFLKIKAIKKGSPKKQANLA